MMVFSFVFRTMCMASKSCNKIFLSEKASVDTCRIHAALMHTGQNKGCLCVDGLLRI